MFLYATPENRDTQNPKPESISPETKLEFQEEYSNNPNSPEPMLRVGEESSTKPVVGNGG